MAHRRRVPQEVADVLLVGFGAVGVMCACSSCYFHMKFANEFLDAFIMERGMAARVTAVCRSNYQCVVGKSRF